MKLEHFRIPGGRRKTLIILGAGASRGASFVKSQAGVLPPLDADFFQQLARMPKCDKALDLLQFVRAEYGHEAGLSMEQFFSEADYTHRFHEELKVDRGAKLKRYQKALDAFYTVLHQLLTASTAGDCEVHRLIAERLSPDDTVLTFNYDCIMDRALRDKGGNRWDPEKMGYGFEITSGGKSWKKHGRGKEASSSIQLLKMHGSMNWQVAANRNVSLRDPNKAKSLQGAVIPPTWFKDLASPPFSEVWKSARIAIRSARIVVVVGYSIPQTDLFSRSLLKVEAGSKAKREKLDLLVLVNPDRTARRTFVDLVRDGLEPTTRVLEYGRFAELGEVLGNS